MVLSAHIGSPYPAQVDEGGGLRYIDDQHKIGTSMLNTDCIGSENSYG